MKLGLIVELMRLPLREGLKRASEMGAEGVQMHAQTEGGQLLSMDANGLKEIKSYCNDLGLEISAICGDLPGHGFQIEEENEARLQKSYQIVDFTRNLGCDVVSTHIGVIPEDRESPEYATILRAMTAYGTYAWNRGVVIAIETGPETAAVLKQFIDDAGTPGVGVNLDPANLVMVMNDDPVAAVRTLAGSIVHTHAKDGIHLKACDPLRVYNAFAEGGFAKLLEETGELFAEKPLGQGAVLWDDYLMALKEVGFTGFLTLEREVGDNPEKDLELGIKFLRNRLAALGIT